MRSASWLAVLLVSGLAGSVQAQCYYIRPPAAPDMLNQPGWYQYNCQGYLYGPYYIVRPPFEPFQGMLPGPQMFQKPGGCAPGQPCAYGGMTTWFPNMAAQQGQGHPGGIPGMWMHPAVRSPRDFFMLETDPARIHEYRYGVGRGYGFGGLGSTTGGGAALGGGAGTGGPVGGFPGTGGGVSPIDPMGR